MNYSGNPKNTKRASKRLTYALVQLLLFVLLVSCGSAPPPAAEPEATLESQAAAFTSTLVAKHSGKCLDLKGGSFKNASPFEQEACSRSEAPEFEFIAVSGQANTYLIKNKRSKKCLDVFRAYKDNRTKIIQYTCGNVPHRQFKLLDAGGGYYQLRAKHSGKCVDVRYALKKDGADIIQYSCQSSSKRQKNGNQLWKITKKGTSNSSPSSAPSSAPPSGGDPSTSPSGTPFSVSLMGRAPEKKTVTFRVNKPKYTEEASLRLWAYDADKALKGKLYINGNGPIKLFGAQADRNNHSTVKALTFKTPSYWWRDGDNKLEFIHDRFEGFKIEKGEVSFSVASVSDTVAAKEGYDLRGTPGFSKYGLTSEQRRWYDRLWKAVKNPETKAQITQKAQSDDAYTYRGDLQDYTNALLTAFRMTGDLHLLDEVSRISELMRKELKDEWRNSLTGDNGKKDGYLNWVTRYSPETNRKFIGKDTQMGYDLKANAHVALFAWAFENNRDLKSPGGYDYAEQADFWEDYLVNHFEAKWRSRNDKATGFPFAEIAGLHTYHSFMKWHYYMGKLTGKGAYTKEAKRMTDVMWQSDFKETSTEYGTGLVWRRAVLSTLDKSSPYYKQLNYLMPQDYARYIIQEAVDLHFEGFDRYAQDSMLKKMSNTVADFVITDGKLAPLPKTIGNRDIGGGRSRAGIPASKASWNKLTPYRFADSSWSYLATWSENAKLERVSEEIYNVVSLRAYDKDPKRVFIPVGMLMDETLN